MDVGALTTFLAPFLPYLAQGQRFGEDAAKRLGAEGWEYAKRFWARLRPSLEAKPAAQEAAEDVAVSGGDDERARSALELQLEKLLAHDAALAGDVARLWDEAKTAGVVAAGERSIAVGGDVSASTIVTGDQNTVGG